MRNPFEARTHDGSGRLAPAAVFGATLALLFVGAACTGSNDAAEGDDAATPSSTIAESADLAEARLGEVDFAAGCGAAADVDFDRAIGLLHHMQYEEARGAFSEIAEASPECGMAQWGIAMTRFQPLWPSRPDAAALEQGRRELAMARETGVTGTRNEHLVRAAEGFYADQDTEWWTRIQRWNDALAEARAANPEDVETAAFYALSELAAAQVAEDRMSRNASAARTLLEIYEGNPAHPGAIHYTIHANDVDSRAEQSLDVVRSYSAIAPAVPHALHMPTHIFVRLGEWEDVIEWNQRSAAAALEHPAGDRISHHYVHAIDYLIYARLQRAEYDAAAGLIETLESETGHFQPTFISAFHLAAAPARYAVERRAWDEAVSLAARDPAYLPWDGFWWAEAMTWFARGLGGVNVGDLELAVTSESRMSDLRDAARDAGENGMAGYIEIDRLVLSAWLARAQGDASEAVTLARAAAELEAVTQKHPVTPGAIYPAHEALGDLFLAEGRYEEALEAFEASLGLWPSRLNSLQGALAAARDVGDEEKAAEFRDALDALTGGTAEPDRVISTE
jgi:tetratricopeptide (TPR) repeat protein